MVTADIKLVKIGGRNINNLRYADDTILMAESEEELKSLWMKVKEDHEKPGLKLNIKNKQTKKQLSSWHPVPTLHANKWGNNGNSDRLFSWVPKSLQMVTAAMKLKDACSLEEKL